MLSVHYFRLLLTKLEQPG